MALVLLCIFPDKSEGESTSNPPAIEIEGELDRETYTKIIEWCEARGMRVK